MNDTLEIQVAKIETKMDIMHQDICDIKSNIKAAQKIETDVALQGQSLSRLWKLAGALATGLVAGLIKVFFG